MTFMALKWAPPKQNYKDSQRIKATHFACIVEVDCYGFESQPGRRDFEVGLKILQRHLRFDLSGGGYG